MDPLPFLTEKGAASDLLPFSQKETAGTLRGRQALEPAWVDPCSADPGVHAIAFLLYMTGTNRPFLRGVWTHQWSIRKATE